MLSALLRGALRRVPPKIWWAVGFVFAAFGAGAGFTWSYREAVFGLLFAPAEGLLSPHGGLPVYTSPTEPLSATIGLVIKSGIATAIPVALVSVYWVTFPIQPRPVRRFLALFIPAGILCFAAGLAFAYLALLPVGLKFLLHFGDGIAVATIRLSEYMALVTSMMFWLGFIFEIPLVMYGLAKVRGVSHTRFRKLRRLIYIAALIFGAIITPTFDWVNQLMVAVPIMVLYEVGLFLAWLARPKPPGYRGPIRRLKDCIRRVVGWLTWPGRMAWRQARRGWRWAIERLRRLRARLRR